MARYWYKMVIVRKRNGNKAYGGKRDWLLQVWARCLLPDGD